LVSWIILEAYKLWSSTLCSLLQPPATSTLLDPNILLSTVFSNTLNLCSSPRVREHVSYPHKTTGTITVFYTLIFRFSDRRGEYKRPWTEWW
jgi:hypothetical protein